MLTKSQNLLKGSLGTISFLQKNRISEVLTAVALCIVSGSTVAAGICIAHPSEAPAPGTSLPAELVGMNMTLLHEESFDDLADFSNAAGVENCIGGSGNGCSRLPDGWSDFLVSEKWNPTDGGGSSTRAGLNINGEFPRGEAGKSLVIWDESRGDTGSWGSDAMLGKYFPDGHKDIYVEYWIQFQPGYRWHHLETSNPQGINYAKLMRIGHRDQGQSPFRFSASGSNAPLVFIDSSIWARDQNGRRTDRASVLVSARCDPQESNYKCGSYPETGRGYINGDASNAESYGDGNWHKLAARMRINSGPGKNDGILMAWFDDQLMVNATDVPWIGSNAPADTLLNMVVLGGNIHNYPEPEGNRFEQWHSIDDVRIFSVN